METVGWMMRDMSAQRVNGKAAFAASEDADSEGEEGRFYVWTEAEVDALLGPEAIAFKQAYDATASGNWEGHTILRRIMLPGSPDQEAGFAGATDILFRAGKAGAARVGRQGAGRRNGLAIAALVRCSMVFGQPAWLDRARQAFDFVLTHMTAGHGGVEHAWRLGRVTAPWSDRGCGPRCPGFV